MKRNNKMKIQEIKDAFIKWQIENYRAINDWSYLHIFPNGDILSGVAYSKNIPLDEIQKIIPYPLTLDYPKTAAAIPSEGYFYWEDDENGSWYRNPSSDAYIPLWEYNETKHNGWIRFKLGKPSLHTIEWVNELFDCDILPKLKTWAEINSIELI